MNQLSLANQFYLREPRTLINPGTAFINRIARAPTGLAQDQALGALGTAQTPLVVVPRSLRPNSRQEYASVRREYGLEARSVLSRHARRRAALPQPASVRPAPAHLPAPRVAVPCLDFLRHGRISLFCYFLR